MKRQTKVSVLAALVILVACGGLWAGATGEQATGGTDLKYLNPTGFPIVKEPITLKGFGLTHPFQAPWADMQVFQVMEKLTNIRITWETVPQGTGGRERLMLKFATNDLPDVFYRVMFQEGDLTTYGPTGALVDMNPYLDKYAPNIAKMYREDPSLKLTGTDGKLYALGTIEKLLLNNAQRMWINKKWLDRLGLPMPTSPQQFLDTMIAFRDRDPNGNGKKDEVGLSAFSTTMDGFLAAFMGAWGLGNRGQSFLTQTGCDVGPDGNLRYLALEPRYKELLMFMNRLWSEGLIDKDIYTHTNADWQALGAQDRLGWSFANNPSYWAPNQADFTWLMPLKGPYGDQAYSYVSSVVVTPYTFAITSANKYPEATMRWVDYFYTDPGYELLFWGVEGVTFTKNSAGQLSFVDSIAKDPGGKTIAEMRGRFTPLIGGSVPYLWTPDHWYKSHAWANLPPHNVANQDSLKAYEPFLVKTWFGFSFAPAEVQTVNDYRAGTGQYVTEMRDKFITGAAPFTEWDNYLKTVRAGGFDKYQQVLNAAYGRFKGK